MEKNMLIKIDDGTVSRKIDSPTFDLILCETEKKCMTPSDIYRPLLILAEEQGLPEILSYEVVENALVSILKDVKE